MADDTCISRFFLESESSKSPNRIPVCPTEPLDSSLDASQNSQNSLESDVDMISLTNLCIEEKEPLHIQPFYNITPREMPSSPHYIFEEEFSTNPWAILVATIFLTKTAGRNARPHMKSFFEEYPTPYHVLDDNPTSLERFFLTLGLKKRGHTIWKLSYQFVSSKWRRASDLFGIGKYGEDAYRIFCLGHTDLDPEDRYLRLYLDWLRNHTDFSEDHGITDSESMIEDLAIKYYKITLRN